MQDEIICDTAEKITRVTNQKYNYDIRSYIRFLKSLKYQRNPNCIPTMDFDDILLPPAAYLPRVGGIYPGKMLWCGINKVRSPVFCAKWLRDGIHLLSGSSNGELSLWDPIKMIQELNFQAHECAIRAITVSWDGNWILTADHNGHIKYWQPSMTSAYTLLAHSDPIRDVSFSPTDQKFASCSDDGLIKIWDFENYTCESTLQGHGTDIKCLDWNGYSRLIASGSKDCQQPIMLWDPRTTSPLCTIHIHKNAVMSIKWNKSGNLFATASKDKSVKVFDIRAMKELQCFRGHKKEVYSVTWHTVTDSLLSSGGGDGSLIHWRLGEEKEIGSMENAHDGVIWEATWHQEGHIVATVSNDHSCKIWSRNDPQSLIPEMINVEFPKKPAKTTDISDHVPLDTPIFRKVDSDPSNRPPISHYPSYHRYFTCRVDCSIPSTKSRGKYPIGRVPKARVPDIQQNEQDEAYIYNDSVPFDTPTPVEYEEVFEEDEEEAPMVRFVRPVRVLNHLPSPVIDHIDYVLSRFNISGRNPLYGDEPHLDDRATDSSDQPFFRDDSSNEIRGHR